MKCLFVQFFSLFVVRNSYIRLALILLFLFVLTATSLRGREETSLSTEGHDSSIEQIQTPPSVLVIFGATGDLTAKKLAPALYNLSKEGLLSNNTVMVGVANSSLTTEIFRQKIEAAVEKFSKTNPEEQVLWEHFKNQIFYHQASFSDGARYENLQQFLLEIDAKFGTEGNRLYYLATPPSFFPTIVDQLHKHGLIYDGVDTSWSRVVIEKPFGTDLESAIELQAHVSKYLKPDQIFRIDHYLGKEGVQNLLALRFENSLFEPTWNKRYIDNVQITLSEEIGIGTRGLFWEETGALRDLLQNHLLQLLAIVAMEPPRELKAASIHEEKVKVLEAIRPFPLDEIDCYVVRGQYGPGIINDKPVLGYRQEQSVSDVSDVETYVAAKIMIDNERWEGVPFYIRGGKRLAKQVTQIVVTFKAPPGKAPNVLSIRIQPNMGIFLSMEAKVPGLLSSKLETVTFGYTLDSIFPITSPEAYEKLIYDVLKGDSSLFVEAQEQLVAWKLLTPVLWNWKAHSADNFPNYEAGSWGPQAADALLDQSGHHWVESPCR